MAYSISPAQRRQIRELYRPGVSKADIAAAVGVSVSTVYVTLNHLHKGRTPRAVQRRTLERARLIHQMLGEGRSKLAIMRELGITADQYETAADVKVSHL